MNLRVRRTDYTIRTVFVQLVLREGFNKVTVSQIAQEGMINRQTFYKHYLDKYDLAEKMMREMLVKYEESAQERLALAQANMSFNETLNTIKPVLNHLILENRDEIVALRSIHLDTMTFDDEIKKRISTLFSAFLVEEPSAFELNLLDSVAFGFIDFMLQNGELPDNEELVQSIEKVMRLFR